MADEPVRDLDETEAEVARVLALWEREECEDSLSELAIRLVRLVRGPLDTRPEREHTTSS